MAADASAARPTLGSATGRAELSRPPRAAATAAVASEEHVRAECGPALFSDHSQGKQQYVDARSTEDGEPGTASKDRPIEHRLSRITIICQLSNTRSRCFQFFAPAEGQEACSGRTTVAETRSSQKQFSRLVEEPIRAVAKIEQDQRRAKRRRLRSTAF